MLSKTDWKPHLPLVQDQCKPLIWYWLGITNMLELEWVQITYKRQNDLLCTCMHNNTANLSKPTAFMNRIITSTLPRTWQDMNRSLGPHRHLQLATVYKKVYLTRCQSWSNTINCSCNSNILSLRNNKFVLFLVFKCFSQVNYI